MPAPGKRASHALDVERHVIAIDDTTPAVQETEHLVFVRALRLANNGPNRGVEAGTVATTCEDTYSHRYTILSYPLCQW